jgi:hypothetical protein
MVMDFAQEGIQRFQAWITLWLAIRKSLMETV